MGNNTTCCICSETAEHFINISHYEIYKCCKCRHAFVHPLNNEIFIDNFYNTEDAELWNSGGISLAKKYLIKPHKYWDYFIENRYKLITSYLPEINNRCRILDVGCSSALFLATLRDYLDFRTTHGVEISDTVREFVVKNLNLDIFDSIENAPKEYYDIVTMFDVIEHVNEPVEFLITVKVLKPSGKLIILTPNHDSLLRILTGKRWLWYITPAHLHFFTPQSLDISLEKSGFNKRNIESMNPGTYFYFPFFYLMQLLKKSPSAIATDISHYWKILTKIDKIGRIFLFPLLYYMKCSKTDTSLLSIS